VAIPISRLDSVAEVACFDDDDEALATLTELKERDQIDKLRIESNGLPQAMVFSNEEFDVVICRYAMHHFPKQEEVVQEIFRCLKPGGLLLVSDPAMPEHCRDTTHPLYHIRQESFFGYSTFHELTDMIVGGGFETLAIRSYGYQRGTLNDFLNDSDPSLSKHLSRAWCELDEKSKRELKWSGDFEGPFITYPIVDIAARKPNK